MISKVRDRRTPFSLRHRGELLHEATEERRIHSFRSDEHQLSLDEGA